MVDQQVCVVDQQVSVVVQQVSVVDQQVSGGPAGLCGGPAGLGGGPAEGLTSECRASAHPLGLTPLVEDVNVGLPTGSFYVLMYFFMFSVAVNDYRVCLSCSRT